MVKLANHRFHRQSVECLGNLRAILTFVKTLHSFSQEVINIQNSTDINRQKLSFLHDIKIILGVDGFCLMVCNQILYNEQWCYAYYIYTI
jgi:hypothetical protein